MNRPYRDRPVVLSANTSWYLFNFRASTITELIDRGCTVVCVSPLDNYAERLTALGAIHIPVFLTREGMNPIVEARSLLSYLRVYRRMDPAVVLNFTPKCNIYSGLIAALLGVPYINNISGVGYLFGRSGFAPELLKVLYRITLRPAHRVMFQNANDLRVFLAGGYVREEQARRVWGSGVPLSRFGFAPRRAQSVVRCLFVGRLLAEKGVVHFVEAAKLLQGESDRFTFHILGPLDPGNPSGISEARLQDWVNDGVIEYLGVSDRVETLLPDYDLIILPSEYGEGMPRSLLEAAAMGKVIVTSDHPGCREAVVPGSGYLLPSVTPEAIASAIRDYRDLRPEQKLAMSRSARTLAESRFSDQVNIREYLAALEPLDVLSGR